MNQLPKKTHILDDTEPSTQPRTQPRPCLLPISNHLPSEARRRLMEAARTPCPGDDLQPRDAAVDKAAAWVRSKWPEYFA